MNVVLTFLIIILIIALTQHGSFALTVRSGNNWQQKRQYRRPLPSPLVEAQHQGLLQVVAVEEEEVVADNNNNNNNNSPSCRRPPVTVYCLGTVHIGSTSAREAKLLIETVQPDTVILEMAPSRVATLRRQRQQAFHNKTHSSQPQDSHNENNNESLNDNIPTPTKTTTTNNTNDPFHLLFHVLPALAGKGWTAGGFVGFLFATTILWTSLVKQQADTQQQQQEDETSPLLLRVNEFSAALDAADQMGATVVACDWELEELIHRVAQALSRPPSAAMTLVAHLIGETFGWRSVDPIRRRRDETWPAWERRRRDIATARASRQHGQAQSPALARVLVHDRDECFAQACRRQAQLQARTPGEEDTHRRPFTVVCIVGLVHLDGVVERLQRDITQVPK